MKRLVTDYPRLLCFSCAIIGAYVLYRHGAFNWIEMHLNGFGYPSIFLAGTLYTFGFTSPFAASYFIAIAPDVSPIPAALLGGIGSTLADLTIFQLVTVSFHQEWIRLRTTSVFNRIHALFHHETVPEKLPRIGKWILSGVVLASPLPDEIGLTIISGIANLSERQLILLCFCCNTLGILALLLIGR